MPEPSEPGGTFADDARQRVDVAAAVPSQSPRRPSFKEAVRRSPLTFVLAAINVAVFLWAELSGDTTTVATLLRFGATERVHVWAGEPWRLATYMFLHIGWIHLVWNTYASVGWSVAVERALGSGRFLFVYLVSGVAAGATSVLCHEAVTAGASGAMFGIIGATLILRRRMLPSWDAFFRDRGVRTTLLNIAIWTALGLTAIAMDNYAHGGGLVTGALAAWIFTREGERRNAWLLFAAACGALIVGALRPGWHPRGSDADAVTGYAAAYRTGQGVGRDAARAERIAQRGCTAHVTTSCIELGLTLLERDDPASRARAETLFHDACAEGEDSGCAAEGFAIATLATSPAEHERGVEMVRRACLAGDKWACSVGLTLQGGVRSGTSD